MPLPPDSAPDPACERTEPVPGSGLRISQRRAGNFGDSDNIKAAPALPGWTVYYGTTTQGSIDYNDASVGGVNVSLFSSACRQGAPFGLIQGRYYVLLQEGLFGSSRPGDPLPWATASIAQTGQVPTSATSLTFRASIAQLTVSLGRTMLPRFLDHFRVARHTNANVGQFCAGQGRSAEVHRGRSHGLSG